MIPLETPLDRLVTELHKQGVTTVAIVLEAFIKASTVEQRTALQRSIFEWLGEEYDRCQ